MKQTNDFRWWEPLAAFAFIYILSAGIGTGCMLVASVSWPQIGLTLLALFALYLLIAAVLWLSEAL